MVESVEELRQLEGMLGQIGRLARRNGLIHDVRSLRSRQPDSPYLVALCAIELLSGFRRGETRICRELIRIQPTLAKNIRSAHRSILRIGPGFAFKAECFFEIKGNYGILGVLEHEISQCADGNLPGNGAALGVIQFGMARVDFFFR